MKKIYISISLVVSLFVTKSSFAAIDIFMRIYDNNNTIIPGESINQYFQNWTELTSVAESSISALTTGAGGTGRPTLNPLKFQIPTSSVSLPMLSMLYKGTRARSVDIWFVRAGATSCACAFYKIHMENVSITALESASTDEQLNQQISFSPQQIAWAYYKQSVTGTYPSTPTNKFGWDILANTDFSYNF